MILTNIWVRQKCFQLTLTENPSNTDSTKSICSFQKESGYKQWLAQAPQLTDRRAHVSAILLVFFSGWLPHGCKMATEIQASHQNQRPEVRGRSSNFNVPLFKKWNSSPKLLAALYLHAIGQNCVKWPLLAARVWDNESLGCGVGSAYPSRDGDGERQR